MDYESVIPVYVQLADVMRHRINTGDILRKVPSVRTLMQEYGVSQATATHALAILRDEGLIESAPGKGFYVVERRR